MYLLLLAALSLLAVPSAADGAESRAGGPGGELERLAEELARLAGERDQLLSEQRRLSVSAASLADEIERLKQESGGARARRELSGKLRSFDPVAAALDAAEAKLAGIERRLQRARADFGRVAESVERELFAGARRDGARAAAEALARLAAERERVSALPAAGGEFRPLLEVTLGPLDGVSELEAKLAIIDGELSRAAGRRLELQREERVLAVRLDGARQWARDLGSARREAAGGFETIEQGYERAEALRGALAARMTATRRESQELHDSESRLAARRNEAEERLRSLREGRR